jgi:hypothetical protein
VAGTSDGSYLQVNVFGWSRGFVGFRTAIDETSSHSGTTIVSDVMVSTASSDGIHSRRRSVRPPG